MGNFRELYVVKTERNYRKTYQWECKTIGSSLVTLKLQKSEKHVKRV